MSPRGKDTFLKEAKLLAMTAYDFFGLGRAEREGQTSV